MGSSLDIIGSYIIGGLVLVLMTGVIINFQEGAQQTTLNEISQVSMSQMSQTMDKEINNLGYRVPGQKIVSLNYRSITFLSDYDNDGIVDTISYEMGRTRTGPTVTRRISTPGSRPLSWTTRGSMVLFTGYDSTGNPTTNASLIRGVEASMLTSNVLFEKLESLTTSAVASTLSKLESSSTSQLAVSHDQVLATAVDCQAGAYWHKVMYPRNLGTVPPQLATTNPGTSTGTLTPEPIDPVDPQVDPVDPQNDPVDPPVDPVDPPVDPGDTGEGSIDPPPVYDPCDPPPAKTAPCCCGSGLMYFKCCGK